MKKIFILIIFACVFFSPVHTVEVPLPVDLQKQYGNMRILIQNTDAHAFKAAYDAVLLLPIESLTELEQLVAEVKVAVNNEIESVGYNTKNWSKIAQGILATSGGSWVVAAMVAFGYDVWIARRYFIPIRKRITLLNAPITLALTAGVFFDTRKGSATRTCTNSVRYCIIAVSPTLICSGFMCGYKNIQAGWNYKQYLQEKLTNLDAIARIVQISKKYKLLIYT